MTERHNKPVAINRSPSRFQHDSGSCFCSFLVSRASFRPERLGKSLWSSGPGWPGAGGTGSKLLSTVATCATISAGRGYARKNSERARADMPHPDHANDPRPMWRGSLSAPEPVTSPITFSRFFRLPSTFRSKRSHTSFFFFFFFYSSPDSSHTL